MTPQQATKILLDFLEEGSKVKAVVDMGDHFLFIAHRPDPLEGKLDPFFRVEKKSGAARDWSPQNYSNPVEVLDKLRDAYAKGGNS